MSELYWITRFNAIHAVFVIILAISAVVLAVSIISWLINDDEDYECERKARKHCENVIHKCIFPFILGILGIIFVPTTKEALLIYGVGGTIDYLQANPTAQKLPDKCIKALDRWVDSLNSEEKDSIK